jgi:hypothetical protein
MGYKDDYCTFCKKTVEKDHWYWRKTKKYKSGGIWKCKVRGKLSNLRYRERVKKDPIRKEKVRNYQKEWSKSHPIYKLVKAYRSSDKKRGLLNNIFIKEAKELFKKSCYYCGATTKIGLDRIDNTKGHTLDNVLTCCEKCNNILSDLPMEAKEILKKGLTEIREKNLLETWIIPTKRGHNKWTQM